MNILQLYTYSENIIGAPNMLPNMQNIFGQLSNIGILSFVLNIVINLPTLQ